MLAMKRIFQPLFPYLALLLLVGSGCSQQSLLTTKYPFWGETVFLEREHGNSPLHLQLLLPEESDTIRGCMLMVHGMNEYIGRYSDIARHFADRFVVVGVDMTAHGLTNPVLLKGHQSMESGQAEYDVSDAFIEQAQLRNLDPMRNDIDLALHYLIERCDTFSGGNARLPVFILSHSLGSLVSASYLLQSKDSHAVSRVKGIIFSGPAFSVTEVPGWRGWFQTPLVHFTFYTHDHFLNPHNEPLPLMILNQTIALVTVPIQDGTIELVSLPGTRSLFSPTTPDWVIDYLTDWEEEKDRHRKDDYILRRSVLRYVLGVEKEIIRFRRKMDQFDIPYLLIYSEEDPITPAWGNTDFAESTLLNHRDNELMPLLGKSHHEQLFSKPELTRHILATIDQWLKLRLDGTVDPGITDLSRP